MAGEIMPSRPATRADDKRLSEPGKKRKKKNGRVVKQDRMQDFLDGKITVEDLDDEEIAKGQFRSADGTFRGNKSRVVPRKFYDALSRESLKRADKKFREELEPSIKVLAEIRDNNRAPADARYKSAVYLLERAVGKVPEKSEVKVEVAPWEADIAGILVDDDEEKEEARK